MPPPTTPILTLLLAALLTGCSTLEVTHDYDPDADFSRLQTYDWLPPPKPTGDPHLDNNTILDSRVRRAVDAVFAEKVYTQSTADPDFKVGYHFTFNEQRDVHYIDNSFGYWGMYPGPYYPGWGPYYGPYPGYGPAGYARVYTYLEGTLILDVFDARSKRLIWRSTARDEVHFKDSPEKRQERLDEAARKMLADFPARR